MNDEENFADKHIPSQEIGEQMDVVEQRSFEDEIIAIDFFELAKYRLLDVNNWTLLTGSTTSNFKLTNSFGNTLERLVEKGDYIKIDIPGPSASIGEGYDWVFVETIAEEHEAGTDVVSLTVRPAANPLSNNNDTAHFLTEQATSTFQIKRIGRHIYAEEHGRNEQANTYTGNTADNIRNMLVGWAAMLGLSYPQWKSLVSGLIKDPE
ncbi:hypothetical protein D3C87_369370 [compost metagenome]